MLILRRRAGEAILIGSDIEIEIVEVSHSRVKLGIRAPKSVSVTRRETVPLALENRRAMDFLNACGPEGVQELLRILQQREPDAQGRGSVGETAYSAGAQGSGLPGEITHFR
jgi:carbon storage regulator